MLYIIDEKGKGHGALGEFGVTHGVNGEKSISGTIYTNEEVIHGIDRGWKLRFEGETYAFIYAKPVDLGEVVQVEFDAVHSFFYDFSKSAVNEQLKDGSHTMQAYLDFIFKNTGYSFRLDTQVGAFEKQSFGYKNRLALFNDVINSAGVEFSVNGSVVRILDRVGNDLSTVVRKGFNLNDITIEKNIGDFVTAQKGLGAWKDQEDHSKGRLEVEYVSPLAEIYGRLDADPVVDERYTNADSLKARLEANVEGSYSISVALDMADLTKAGYEYKQPQEGDYIMAINEDLGFKRRIRIVSYTSKFDTNGELIDHNITANSIGMVQEAISGQAKMQNSINELRDELVKTQKEVIEVRVSADGKTNNYWGAVEPSPDVYKLNIGDTWYDSSGEDVIIKAWNGVEWRRVSFDKTAFERQFAEIEKKTQEMTASITEADNRSKDALNKVGVNTDLIDEHKKTLDEINGTLIPNINNSLTTALNSASNAMLEAQKADGKIADYVSRNGLVSGSEVDFKIDEATGTITSKITTLETSKLDGSTYTNFYENDYKKTAQSATDAYTAVNKIVDANGNAKDTFAKAVYERNAQRQKADFDLVTNDLVKKATYEAGIDGVKESVTSLEGNIKDLSSARNLLKDSWHNSEDSPSIVNTEYRIATWHLSKPLEVGKTYTFRLFGFSNREHFMLYTPNGLVRMGDFMGNGTANVIRTDTTYNALKNRRVWEISFTATQYTINNMTENRVSLYNYPSSSSSNGEIYWATLVEGTVGIDWQPAISDMLGTKEFSLFKRDYEATDKLVKERLTAVESTTKGHTTSINDVKKTADGNEALIAKIQETPTSYLADYQKLINRANLVERTLGTTDSAVGENVSRIVQTSGIIQQQISAGSKKNIIPFWEIGGLVWADGRDYEATDRIRSGLIYREPNTETESNTSTTYTFSNNGVKEYVHVVRYRADGTFFDHMGVKQSFSLTDAVPYARLVMIGGSLNNEYQLERGNSATYYVAPSSQNMSSTITQLSNSWALTLKSGNDVKTAINATTDGLRLKGDLINLDAKTTVAEAFWAKEVNAIKVNADNIVAGQIDGSRIRANTIDTNRLAGNISEFIRTNWNAVNAFTQIDANGIQMLGSGAWRRTFLTPTGFNLYNGQGASDKAGAIGYFKSSTDLGGGVNNPLKEDFMWQDMQRHTIGIGVNDGHLLSLGYQNPGAKSEDGYNPALTIDPGLYGRVSFLTEARFNQNVYFDKAIKFTDREYFNITNGLYLNTDYFTIMATTGMRVFRGGQQKVLFGGNMQMHTNIDMNGNTISNQSDERLKKNIKTLADNDFEKLMSVRMISYEWENPDKQAGTHIGFSAQELQRVYPELILKGEDGYLGIDSNGLAMAHLHAFQQHVQKTNTTIERLEHKIASLQDELALLKGD